MSDQHCEMARNRIPDLVAGRLSVDEADEVSAHLPLCGECTAEAELVALLYEGRPAPPEHMVARIEGALRSPGGGGVRPWWGLAAAAVAAVALGIGVITDGNAGLGMDIPAYVAATDDLGMWLGDDGLIAGAPALEDLSEEALLTLLEEMTSGGAA